MEIKTRRAGDAAIAEIVSEKLIIQSAGDGADLVGNLYFQGFDKAIIHEKNIAPDFFDLKSGIAGEILQKFSNYRIKLAIVGEFQKYNSRSLRDFIYESNKGGHICFVQSVDEALSRWK